MAERFKDKVVMITGAASGFGAKAAQSFAAEGAKLALCDLDADSFTKMELPKGTLIARVDVSREDDIAEFVSKTISQFGQLDVAINNAGISNVMKPLTATPVEEFDRIMAVNARGVFLGMKHQLPPMMSAGQGAVLNISSAAGVLGAGYLSAYAASKHAVVGLTRAAADEAARKGVRVNALCPAFASTPMFETLSDEMGAEQGLSPQEIRDKITARVPMRRVADAHEIVQAMLWACAPENSFMTGQAISIDGGLSAV